MIRAALIIEFLCLFVALPLAYRFSPVRIPALPLLWIVAAYAGWQLVRDPQFNRTQLWNAGELPAYLPAILTIFVVAAFLLWLGVRLFAPELEWNFVRRQPVFWAVVMVAYPVLSVYPQGLLYRAFFFARYTELFPGRWAMIVASASAFAFLHIIFRNPLAPALTFAGGLLFAYRYDQTGSLAVSSSEHALYGCWLFTIGMGQFFYHRTIVTVGTLMRRCCYGLGDLEGWFVRHVSLSAPCARICSWLPRPHMCFTATAAGSKSHHRPPVFPKTHAPFSIWPAIGPPAPAFLVAQSLKTSRSPRAAKSRSTLLPALQRKLPRRSARSCSRGSRAPACAPATGSRGPCLQTPS